MSSPTTSGSRMCGPRSTPKTSAAPGAETLTWAVGCTPAAGMANVLSAEKRQQVIAVGWLGWSLRRIEEATGVRRERGAEERLLNLARNSSEPAIVRATALDVLRRYGPASLPVSVEGTRDPDPAVRTAAVASLERVPPDERVSLVAPLLGDPVRAVRIEAARVLSSVPSDRLDASQRRAAERAVGEFIAAQSAALDLPGPHLNLAVLYENQGRHALAEEHYRTALRLDPDFTPARLNLARLLNELGRNPDAEHVLRDGIARVPDEGELHYSLGLLLGEGERLPEAAAALGRAADLMPARARVRYNEALALQRLGRLADAEAAFVKAQNTDPE